uniref:Dynein-1, subspecies f n=2 Tax=Timema TaxID=61471 RepID=A0A7R9P341_TIMCA|nr:unnamed protein product [Timema californicum]
MALSDEERVLFRELIRGCDKKINPGLHKLQWNTDVSDLYISECCQHTAELQVFVDDFKNSNLEVVRICEKICDTPLIEIPHGIVYKLKDLDRLMAKHREEMGKVWTDYIHKMDTLLEEAIKLCCRSSLQIILNILHGEGVSGPSPFISLSILLVDLKLTFSPTIQEISGLVRNVKQQLVHSLRPIPRLHEKFRVPANHLVAFHESIDKDNECVKIQNLINEEMLTNTNMIINYAKTWDQFRTVWDVNKDLFISRYENLDPPVSSFESDISRYSEVAINVLSQESVSHVYFLIINCSLLKQSIVEHCVEWQRTLTLLLKNTTKDKMDDIYQYIKENSERVMKVPTTLRELQEHIPLHEALVEEVPEKEKIFPNIEDRFVVLDKFEVEISVEMQNRYVGLKEEWQQYLKVLEEAAEMLQKSKEKFRTGLLESAEALKKEAKFVLEDFFANGPFSSNWKAKDALNHLANLREHLTEMRKQEEKLRSDLGIFNISIPLSQDLEKLEKDLTALEVVWELSDDWDTAWESYKTGAFQTIQTQEMEATYSWLSCELTMHAFIPLFQAQKLFRKLTRLSRELKEKQWEIVDHTRDRVDAFRRTLPLIGDLKNTAMRERHWGRVKMAIGRDFDENSPEFTLDLIMEMNMQNFSEDINEISNAASMELQIEMGLKLISENWAEIFVEMEAYKEKGMYCLKAVDKIFETLEDNQVSLGTMKSTRFVEPFIKQVDYWERTLSTIMEVLEIVLIVQRQYLYLENIFLGEDIRKQLPKESFDFDNLTSDWKEITNRMNRDRNALRATHYPNLWERLNSMNQKLESIQRALEKYLETKRHIFPRFYFISNDDLLEILAQSKKPENVQPHLKKCFDNINKLKIAKGPVSLKLEGQGMFSAEGEYIDFSSPIILEGPVELWLCRVEDMMRLTLREQLKLCRASLRKNLNKRDKWIKDWPGQLCITSSQIQWTTDCTRTLLQCKMMEAKKPLKKLRRKQNQVLGKFSDAVRGTLTKQQRTEDCCPGDIGDTCTGCYRQDEVTNYLIEELTIPDCMDVSAFEWLSQLRFYWDRDIDDCIVRQTNTYFVYGYEYLGNSGRLVITPLTDRCYITLTTALHLKRGGSPKGPAGTGKTETVKDLGKSLGSYVIVVNCSEGLDYKSMGRMFSGLAQTGAWGCFDEFNRINIEVLSVVAQQILSILSALAAGLKRFVFESTDIGLVHSCGIFITMNPGYAGRTELPDNLKSMFRPISMVVPDSAMIAEITLFGEGFKDTRILAKKVFTLYSLAMQQLSKQDHYDFGLRGMVALLRYAGRKRRMYPTTNDEDVLLLAMKDMNIAKLTADDLPLFNGITADLFPGVDTPTVDYEELATAVEAELKENGMQSIPNSVTKVIQLYETKSSRHSVMIVGRTGSGKTATWRTLQGSLTRLNKQKKPGFNIVKDYPINPKALYLGELYGEFNLATNEWSDGVLSAIMRETCSDESPDEKWIMQKHFDRYVNVTLDYKRLNCEETVAVGELSAVVGLCKLLECLATKQNGLDPNIGGDDSYQTMAKMWFLFCTIWSICAAVNEHGRKKIDAFIREMEGVFPLRDTVYEYFVDPRTRSFVSWEERLQENWKYDKELPFFKITVPTVDTVRYQYLVSTLLSHSYAGLLVGPVGTGKTSTAQAVLESLDDTKYSLLMINMSAQTTSNNVQDIVESRVEKRTKGVYVPPGGKTMITFMDDFNMPAKEVYGAQPPLELIRQWMDYGFWYDRQKQTKTFVKEMLLMGSMGPPGGGRNQITGRLLSRFNVINMTFPSEAQIVRIFNTMLSQQLQDFDEEVKIISKTITDATVSMYYAVIAKMLPTPAKIHYLFNLRDISKVFQGLLRSNKDSQNNKTALQRLWVHECFRVFSDRLVDDKDREWFSNQINEQLGKHFDTTFHGVCPEKTSPIFVDFVNPYGIYEDLQDQVALRNYLEKQLEEYNVSPGVIPMNLVLFNDVIQHISRIVRVISQPRGNMLLVGIGGSGRQSVSRLAAYLCEYTVFQIEVTKNYRLQEFKEDLKSLYRMAGVDHKPTTFLFNDTQISDEAFLEIINNVLSTGEVPNLYKPEEFEEIKGALSSSAAKDKIQPTNEAMFSYLIDRVRTNLHIVLCMSPIGDAFRNRLRQYPALVNCTTIDWFSEWPKQALLEVANKFLESVDFLATITTVADKDTAREFEWQKSQERLREAVAEMFATIHSSVSHCSRRMLLEMKRPNYVTPTNYLELVAGYMVMLEDKRAETAASANKLRNGLFKIDDTREKVEIMSIDLAEAQVKVAEFQQQCDEYLVIILTQRREADEQAKSVAARSLRIGEEELACKKMADLAQADLSEAMPAFEEAIKALDALSKKDLNEIKSYSRPPGKVEMVMEAVMILKGVEPTWAEAKRQLGDINFLTMLREFDKDNISDRTLKKIGVYTSNEEFEPEKVGIVSFAAKSLCMWVIAIEKYAKIYRVVAPKKAKLDEAMSQLRAKQAILAEARAKLEELNERLQKLQKDYDEKLGQKEELAKRAEILKQKLERAAQLVDGLEGEKIRWGVTVQTLDEQFDFLPGNCLLATGFVSYTGPFVSQYRDELILLWKKHIIELEIPFSSDFSVITFLTDPTTIREWNIQGLPSDEFSTENGIIVTRGTRWPLLIDPQCQGLKWIKNMEKAKNLNVIDFGQSDFMKTLEQAIQFGNSVLLQNVMEVLDPSLTPILNKAVVKQGGQMLIKLGEKMVQYNPNFRFFITTKLSNPHYAPEISTKTTMVNFAVKLQGLEAQLLAIVVRKERPQLEEQKDNLVLAIAAGKRTLLDLEDELLRLLNETVNLLDDLQLLITLQTSKTTSISVTEQLQVSETTEVEIDTAREGYRPSAQRASILFFVLNDMSQIDPMYQFSLDSYISLFIVSTEKSQRSAILEERIVFLNEYHTYAVYRNTCRGLFEQHKLLFSFHMCIKILEAQGKVNLVEYNFLLKGGVVLDREEQMDNPCAAWLSEEAWDNVTELDKIPGFHGVITSFEQYPKDWNLWYTNKEPETLPLIVFSTFPYKPIVEPAMDSLKCPMFGSGEWDDICTEFQRMLFVRSLRPDRISLCVTSFVVNTLGLKFVEPPVLDIKAVVEDSTFKTPLIFVLSPGVDPTGSLIQLADTSDMGDKFYSLSLGQGQAPIATRMIANGARDGNWVFLANCHLSLSWMSKLDKIVDTMQTGKVHPQFRLWLSSSPHPDFPISILQAGIKMTTEPPKGIKANMKRLYQLVTETQLNACQNHSKYRKLLFSLCFFHSVLLERKKFQQLGWNVVYSFNDSDFDVSENLLSIYLDEYVDTPWDALKYLIAGVNYGGHVTDDWDRRLLNSYINRFFNDDVLNSTNYSIFFVPDSLTCLHTSYPKDGSLQSYRDYIAFLPNVDQPEAFGQHSNADITSLISETRMLFETLMSLQLQVSVATGVTKEDKVMQLASDVLSKIPEPIDYENTEKLIGANKTPLQVVLLQEIHSSLVELQKGIQGLVVMSSSLEDIFICIYEGRVPKEWLKAYPSLKLLGSWTRDLMQRVEHFGHWAQSMHPPLFFWLAAYTFPTGFLTAVLQTSARTSNVSIDSLSWDFTVSPMEEHLLVEPPADGVYVRGLFLEGAGWDRKNVCLCEPLPMQLVCAMPIIHFKPMEHVKKRTRGMYVCPCYYYPTRCGAAGRESYVVAVDLKSGAENSDHWIKRGTALLLSLSN